MFVLKLKSEHKQNTDNQLARSMIVSAENEHQQQLPREICIDILSRLSTDSILQCKLVCKAWRSIIEQDHVFHAMYTRRLISSSTSCSSSLDFVYLEHVKDKFVDITYDKLRFIEYNVAAADETITMCIKRSTLTLPFKQHPEKDHNLRFMIVGSCNGLICLATYSYDDDDVHHHIFVSNPLTGENIDLSPTTTELHHYQNSSLYLMRIGFGYLPSTNEYKVVRIFTDNKWERRIAYVQVYTLGSRTDTGIRWRTIPGTRCNMAFENRASARARARGVSVNGVIYFNDYTKIISFDLANEEFRIIVPQPTTCITKFEQLGVLSGCLCGTSRNAIPAEIYSETLDLWVMEEEKDTWIKTYSIQYGKLHLHSMPLGNALFPPNSMILLMQPEKENKIISYNAETGFIMSSRNIPGDRGDWYRGNYVGGLEIIPYVKNCVSLKALGEKYTQKGSWRSDVKEKLAAVQRGHLRKGSGNLHFECKLSV